MSIEDIERRWDTATPAKDYPTERTWGPLYLDDDRSLRAYAAAPTDIAYLLDRVRKLERAHAWFVKQGAPQIVHKPRFGEESVHCASCKSEINHLKDCEWVKARELKL